MQPSIAIVVLLAGSPFAVPTAPAGVNPGARAPSRTPFDGPRPTGERPGGPRHLNQLQPVLEDRAYHLTAELATDFPVFVGAEATFELPYRIVVGLGIGGVPTAYLQATSAFVTSVANLDDPAADVVTEALSGSWMTRLFVGWRPVADHGFFFRFGYGALNLSGRLDDGASLAQVTGLPAAAAAGGSTDLGSTLHGVELLIGYRWHLDSITIRAGLGAFLTFGASAQIEVDSPLNPALSNDLARRGEDYLEDIYRTYVFTPSLGLGVGYDFGL